MIVEEGGTMIVIVEEGYGGWMIMIVEEGGTTIVIVEERGRTIMIVEGGRTIPAVVLRHCHPWKHSTPKEMHQEG